MLANVLLTLLQAAQIPSSTRQAGTLELRPEADTIRAGDSVRIEARLSDSAGRLVPDAPIVWSASGEGTVGPGGLVRAGSGRARRFRDGWLRSLRAGSGGSQVGDGTARYG